MVIFHSYVKLPEGIPNEIPGMSFLGLSNRLPRWRCVVRAVRTTIDTPSVGRMASRPRIWKPSRRRSPAWMAKWMDSMIQCVAKTSQKRGFWMVLGCSEGMERTIYHRDDVWCFFLKETSHRPLWIATRTLFFARKVQDSSSGLIQGFWGHDNSWKV